MCGIVGACWTTEAGPVSVDVLRRMTDAIAHRGPDDSGCYHSLEANDPSRRLIGGLSHRPGASAPAAALGHRRLSIIDLAGGHQPLSNEDGTIWIVFNGEIYNDRDLRPGLESQGHRFRTDCDTETIVHLYEQYGPDCVHRLRGMFAFAIWDERRGRLFAARDRLGKKPFVYREEPGRLSFASELKSLLEAPGATREIDPIAVDDFLCYQYVPHSECILKGYRKLPPGHRLLWDAGRLTVERYWLPPYEPGASGEVISGEPSARDGGVGNPATQTPPPLPPLPKGGGQTVDDWQRRLRETLTEAVRIRMRSDVPLGAFLSGGIDSTIVTGLMQSLSSRPVKTFSIGFPVKQFDEREYARDAAKHLGTEHHELVVEPSAMEILPKLIRHYDEPFGDSSAIPTMYLAEMTRRHVTVALSGDGGDELFAGYERYQAVTLAGKFDRLPRPIRRFLASPLWQKIPASVRQRSLRRKAKRFLAALGESPERRYLKWIAIFDDERRRDLYDERMRASLGDHDAAQFLLDGYALCPSRDMTTRTTCADVLTYLPCDILTKVDIATMAVGLEARCPILDQEVAELAARMPLALKQSGGMKKKILIDTFRDLLPASIQSRGKMGFAVPLDSWFRGELQPLLRDVLLDPSSLSRGWFRPEAVRKLVDEHTSSAWDHSYRLWSLLVFELWQRMYVDGGGAP